MVKALALCAALAAIAAGCSSSHTASTTTPTRPLEPPSQAKRPVQAAATRITGGTTAMRAELRDILGTLGATGIKRLAIEPAGHPWTSRHRDAVVLRYVPRIKDLQSRWEGELVAQAFAIKSARAHLPPVVAVQSDMEGARMNIGYRARPPKWTVDGLRQAIARTARRQDARVTVLRVAKLNGRPVTRLRLQVADPARFLVQRASLVLASLPENDAGHFVEVTNVDGRLFSLAANAGNWGMGGNAEAFDSCGPSVHSYPVGYSPPPCPFTGTRVYAQPGARPTRTPTDIVRIAAAHAHEGEKVTLLNAAPTVLDLCRSYTVARCPDIAGTAWAATLSKGPTRRPAERWVMISDRSGRVVASGRFPA